MDASEQRNRVTPEGKAIGAQMARLCDIEGAKLIAEGEWTEDERCRSYAFRLGTVPNGCPQTQMDALKSVMQQEPFFCHVADPGTQVCAGWFACVQASKKQPPVTMPWPYSQPDPER